LLFSLQKLKELGVVNWWHESSFPLLLSQRSMGITPINNHITRYMCGTIGSQLADIKVPQKCVLQFQILIDLTLSKNFRIVTVIMLKASVN